MTKKSQEGAHDLLTLAMQRARDDVAAGRVPKHPPNASMPDGPGVVDDGANVSVEVNEVGADPPAQEPRTEGPHQE